MAINKRKDAAALFELIDKSTLKVPKNAGSLKIPSWWSSKGNPSAETGVKGGANGHAAGRVSEKPETSVSEALPELPVEPVVQHRLFEPPAASAPPPLPGTTPSIRPPSMNAPIPTGATVKAPPTATVAPAVDVSALVEADAQTEGNTETVIPSQARAFAPATYSPGKRGGGGWSSPRPGSMARLPMWAVVSAAAFLIIVVCLIVFAVRGKTPSPGGMNRPVSGAQGISGNPTGSGRGGISNPGSQGTGQSLLPPNRGNVSVNPVPAENVGKLIYTGTTGNGHVYGAGSVARTWDLLYIVIATTPSQQFTERNAKWLADHDVDVSIETQYPNGKLVYTLVSVQGFPSNTAAEPTRMRIIEIGKLLMKNAWNDPTVRRVVSKPPAAAPR